MLTDLSVDLSKTLGTGSSARSDGLSVLPSWSRHEGLQKKWREEDTKHLAYTSDQQTARRYKLPHSPMQHSAVAASSFPFASRVMVTLAATVVGRTDIIIRPTKM